MIYHLIKIQKFDLQSHFYPAGTLGFEQCPYKKKSFAQAVGSDFYHLKSNFRAKKHYCRANFARTKKIFFSKYFNRTNQTKTKESFFSSNSSFKIAFKSNKSLKSEVPSQDHHNQTVKILWRKNQYSIEHHTFLLISHFLFYFCFYSFFYFVIFVF